MYRGVLADGRVIAVKRLTRGTSDERREKEFLTELGTVSHVQHPNVSELVGCCIDLDLHLIFEFSSHGSVSSHLHGNQTLEFKLIGTRFKHAELNLYVFDLYVTEENSLPLTWNLRYGIAVGTAQGLHYLHKGCQRRIIHRDIKASNILLTANYEPQVIYKQPFK